MKWLARLFAKKSKDRVVVVVDGMTLLDFPSADIDAGKVVIENLNCNGNTLKVSKGLVILNGTKIYPIE